MYIFLIIMLKNLRISEIVIHGDNDKGRTTWSKVGVLALNNQCITSNASSLDTDQSKYQQSQRYSRDQYPNRKDIQYLSQYPIVEAYHRRVILKGLIDFTVK